MKTILLVEDDPFLGDIYTTKFKQEGYDIDIAKDGEDCLQKLKENRPEILLLDIVLPDVDGWEILKRISREGFRDMKVIILSNLSQRAEVEKALEMGAVKYLIKARYTPTEVVNEIKNLN